MPIGVDLVTASVKLNNFMESKCFSSWEEFIQALPSMLTVEIPSGVTNVSIGLNQPTDSERGNLWIKTDGSGSFIGLFLYTGGTWNQIYPAPNEVFLMYGDSRNIPAGFQLASSDPNISSLMLTNLQKIWTIGGTGPTYYTVFHVTRTSF